MLMLIDIYIYIYGWGTELWSSENPRKSVIELCMDFNYNLAFIFDYSTYIPDTGEGETRLDRWRQCQTRPEESKLPSIHPICTLSSLISVPCPFMCPGKSVRPAELSGGIYIGRLSVPVLWPDVVDPCLGLLVAVVAVAVCSLRRRKPLEAV